MLRVLLLADTHLGLDLPTRPRVARRRRGDDFFANFERALAPAVRGDVDLILDRPTTVQLRAGGHAVAVAGFPFARDVASRFDDLLRQTRWSERPADFRLLCIHQAVEGATVGPSDFVFRSGSDVLAGRRIPKGLDAVLCGHIHRAQRLTRDGRGRALAAPVFYPGAIERTSRAERHERKGYLRIDFVVGEPPRWRFVELPARPMVDLTVRADGHTLVERLRQALASADPNAIVRVRLVGATASNELLRTLAPATMNVELAPDETRGGGAATPSGRSSRSPSRSSRSSPCGSSRRP